MKSKAESDFTPSSPSTEESDRARRTSDHPPPPAKLPSWRPTVPGVQPHPTLHGVQPLITLRGLNAPTEHDLPVQRDTPPDIVQDDIDLPRFGAPRVPADLALESSVEEVSSNSENGTIQRRFERAARVRRIGLGVAIAFGTFFLVIALAVLRGAPERPRHAARTPVTTPARAPATAPARAVVARAPSEPGESIPAPPPLEDAAPSHDPIEPTAEQESLPLPSPAAPVSAEPEAPPRTGRLAPPRELTRPSLFSQIPARPAAD